MPCDCARRHAPTSRRFRSTAGAPSGRPSPRRSPGGRAFLGPEEVALGVAVYPRAGTSVSLDAVLVRWSRYRASDGRVPDPPLRDVMNLRVGLEQRLAVAVALRLGYAFEPSPVPR